MFALNDIIVIIMFVQSRKYVNTFYIVQYVTYYNIYCTICLDTHFQNCK